VSTIVSRSTKFPTLQIEATLVLEKGGRHPLLRVEVDADGSCLETKQWRQALISWCRRRNIAQTQANIADRSAGTGLKFHISNWPHIAEFLLDWMGTDFIAQAYKRRIEENELSELTAMRKRLDHIAMAVEDIFARTRAIDYRLWATGQALLGEAVGAFPEIRDGYNWDFVSPDKTTDSNEYYEDSDPSENAK